MGTTEDKLRYLWKSKQDIINALKVKGVEVDPSVPFSEYGAKIKTIEGGGDVILCQNMQALNDLVPVAEGTLAIVYDINTDHFSGLYEGKTDGNWNLVFTTEDGTATSMDIINPKIAYVKGSKVTGGIIPTYDTSIPSELGRNITMTDITIDEINLDYNLAIRVHSTTSFKIYKVINDVISENNATVITPTILGNLTLLTGSGRLNTVKTTIEGVDYLRCYIIYRNSSKASGIYTCLLNLDTLEITNEFTTSTILGGTDDSITTERIVVVPDKNIIFLTRITYNSGIVWTNTFLINFKTLSTYTSTKVVDSYINGWMGNKTVDNISIAPDKRTVALFAQSAVSDECNTLILKLSADGNNYTTLMPNKPIKNKYLQLIDENYYIEGNAIKAISTKTQVGTAPFTVAYNTQSILIGKYYYYRKNGAANWSVYEWDSLEKTLTSVNTLVTSGFGLLHYAKELLYKTTDNLLTGYVNDPTKGALSKLNVSGVDFYSTQYANDISTSNVLAGKKYYNQNGLQIGTMPNNGELTYTPSEQAQTIPAGYTSGGTVKAINYNDTLTPAEYTTALATAKEILGLASDM